MTYIGYEYNEKKYNDYKCSSNRKNYDFFGWGMSTLTHTPWGNFSNSDLGKSFSETIISLYILVIGTSAVGIKYKSSFVA